VKSWIGTSASNKKGDIKLKGSVDLGMDLPDSADANYPDGAKIWLVLSSDYDASTNAMKAWNPTEYLYENNLITHDRTAGEDDKATLYLYEKDPSDWSIIDDGAWEALLSKGKSLLAIGVTKIDGDFEFGDSVGIVNHKGKEVARGLVNYSSKELGKIIGRSTQEIERILGYKHYDEVIHRDDLVVL